ncbi:hypothetical protein KPH14_009716 [Odynerus spinipes]|uniref:Uncharacterized protein n=1 Tax=Odynerus spinipes TaxID=1348599 RepID=A0AAD9VR12_9HYME|nr:hypothetical protein KPH14_009716 [Odynerus spinipes]
MEQSGSIVTPGDLSHEGSDGVLYEGAAETTSRLRRLPRPFTEEERVSLRLFKVKFLERRGQGETGPAGAVFDTTTPNATDFSSLCPAVVLLQGRKEQGIHRQGCYMAAVGCFEELHDGEQFLWLRPRTSRKIGTWINPSESPAARENAFYEKRRRSLSAFKTNSRYIISWEFLSEGNNSNGRDNSRRIRMHGGRNIL